MKRQGQPLNSSLQKKQNTGKETGSSGGGGFSYGNLQKLKQKKQQIQQKIQQSSLPSSLQKSSRPSSSSSQFSYQSVQKQKTLKSDLKQQPPSSSQQQSQQQSIKERQQQMQELRNLKKQAETYGMKALPSSKLKSTSSSSVDPKKPSTSSSSSSSSNIQKSSSSSSQQLKSPGIISVKQQQSAIKQALNKSLISKDSTSIQKNNNAEDQKKPKDYNSLLKYQMKKQMQMKRIQHKLKTGELKIEDLKRKKVEEEEVKIAPIQKNIQMNEEGQIIDEDGNVVQFEKQTESLAINKSRRQQVKIKQLQKNASQLQGSSKFLFDSNVNVTSYKKRDKRKSHALYFIEKRSDNLEADDMIKKIKDGTIIQRSEQDSQKQMENVQQQQKRVAIKIKHHDPIPNIEWWDQPYLQADMQNYFEKNESGQSQEENKGIAQHKQVFDDPELHLKNLEKIDSMEFGEEIFNPEKINIYVEHPSQFKNNQANTPQVIIPYYLTKQETKKIRRKNRLEKEQAKQDSIRLGLLQPPKPKVKLANMVAVYGNEAYLDPSKVEADVRQQMKERVDAHHQRNQEKKLTAEQRKDKFLKKLKKDAQQETRVALFRVENLSDGQHRYKIDANAQQMQLHGFCLQGDFISHPSLVIVQGGPKSVKFFKNLMLRRIKWDVPSDNKNLKDEESEEDEGEGEDKDKMDEENGEVDEEGNKKSEVKKKKRIFYDLTGNKCNLVWEGIVKDQCFNKWKIIDLSSEMEGKRALAERGCDFYWDMVQNFKEVQ